MTDGRAVILRVGLTGGIASGKTTVAGFFRELGAYVLDADRIAREVVAPGGPAFADVVRRFGESILDPSGSIDRSRLGDVVFRDAGARRELEAIVHPRVREEAARRIQAHGAAAGVAVVEAALLVETGSWREYHRLVVVRCSPATQIARLSSRDGMTADDARRRIDAQVGLERRLEVADYVIDAELALDATRRETVRVWDRLRDDLSALRSGAPLPRIR